MSEVNYLYGAAVQGIQSFIFQTNKLREIVGASELVEEICTSKFKDLFGQVGITYNEGNCILHAAGNIKYIFETKEECEKIVTLLVGMQNDSATSIIFFKINNTFTL